MCAYPFLSGIAFLIMISWQVSAATLDEANAAYAKKDYAASMSMLIPLADHGDASAQYLLGVIYGRGNAVVAEDDVAAAKWYRMAAEQGHEGAQARTALMYAFACGVDKNDVEAAKWFQRSADQGAAGSMFHLGRMYLAGRGVPKRVDESIKLWTRSAELGYARAQYFLALISQPDGGRKKAEAAELQINDWLDAYVNNDFPRALAVVKPLALRGDAWAQAFLGSMYEKGEGTVRDEAEGVKWSILAADQGYSLSQSELATRYATGQGLSQSTIQAYKWASLAAMQHDQSAKKLQVNLAATMKPTELEEAQRLINEWKVKH